MSLEQQEDNSPSDGEEGYTFINNDDISQVYCVVLKNGIEIYVNVVAKSPDIGMFIFCNALKNVQISYQTADGKIVVQHDLIPWLSHVKSPNFFFDEDNILVMEEASEMISNLFYTKIGMLKASEQYKNAFFGIGENQIQKSVDNIEQTNKYPEGTVVLRELDEGNFENKLIANVHMPNNIKH